MDKVFISEHKRDCNYRLFLFKIRKNDNFQKYTLQLPLKLNVDTITNVIRPLKSI